MKKHFIFVLLILLSIIPSHADEFVIKDMNGQKIQIGAKYRICKVGSTFNSSEEIHWGKSEVTIIEAQNVKTKTICYFVPKGKQNKDKSQSSNILQRFLNYFVKMTRLSTRESEIYDLEEALTVNDFLLVDTIRIKTYNQDLNKQYYASFFLNGKKRTIQLPVENGDIIFERSQFLMDDITLPYKFILTIYTKEDDYYQEVTNGMSITVFDTGN